MKIKYTYCQNFSSAETREAEWDAFADTLTTFTAFPNKDASIKRAAFVGGVRTDETKGRADGNIAVRSVATLDFDTPVGTLDEIEFQLDLVMPCAFVAYSTFRHTPDVPRFRLCVPLSRPVNEIEHRMVVNDIIRLVDLGKVDPCSFTMAQLMFLPSHKEGVTPWAMSRPGGPWEVNITEVEGSGSAPVAVDDDLADFVAAVAAEPITMSVADVDALLENYPADGKDYDEWLRVGMALYHQFRGSEDGYSRWLEWSKKSPKHEPRQMRMKWRSFGGSAKPVTMASIIKLAGGRRTAVEIAPTSSIYGALEAEASGAKTHEAYTAFRNKVSSMSEAQLHMDSRSMLANLLQTSFGRSVGLSLSEVKKALKPAKGKSKGDGFFGGDAETPEWAKDTVHCAGENTLERISTRHSVKPDAFRIAHAGEPEVIAAELDAVTYLMRNKLIPRVAAKMYWPGFGPIFTDANTGLTYLNTYERDGVEPCAALDDDGQAVADRFMRHLAFTVGVERERSIVLDFMAFVYQNPGKRVQWALLLKGIEGNGKTYFFRVMERLMGRQTSVVSTTAIASDFTGWAEGSVLACVEEIYIQGLNKYAILNKLKPMITNDQIPVVSKNKNERTVPNFTSYMMMTNHADAIPVGDGDRRYCVIFTRQTRKEDLFNELGGKEGVAAYFNNLFGDLERRPDALARFLTDYKVSADFSPAGRAPETSGLHKMRALSVSEDRQMFEEAIQDHACEVVGPDVIDVTHLNKLLNMEFKGTLTGRAIRLILAEHGYSQIEDRRVKIKTRDHYVWFREGIMTSDGAIEKVRAFHRQVEKEPDDFA